MSARKIPTLAALLALAGNPALAQQVVTPYSSHDLARSGERHAPSE